ncbi:MAG: ABC transporter substrate-binding protein [Lachnospiraceae bacterium]|nr:ABC transporter substrate-binding protein [Lachnospiraceae bacterium]
MKKIIAGIMAVLLGICVLAACGKQEEPVTPEPSTAAAPVQDTSVKINVTALKGPTGMGMAYLNQQSDDGLTAYKYDISYAGAPDEVVGGLINGEIQIAALPVNLGATLYNKTQGEILTAAVNTLGVIYIVENGDTVHSLADLAGKKIVGSGQGSTPEYALNYLLEKNGLAGQVEVEYVSEHDEAVTALVSGTADIVMIPEPKVTAALSQLETARIAVSLTEEWEKVSDTEMITGVIVVRKSFAEEHPEIVDTFLKEYAESVEYTIGNMEDAAQLIEKYGIIPKAAVALKALPNCNIVYMDGAEMAASVTEMLTTLYDANPASVGGSLPGEEMFYKAK